jgi:hypothetical protein
VALVNFAAALWQPPIIALKNWRSYLRPKFDLA